MGDLLKSVVKLEVSGDGRSAENYNSYKVQLENALSAKDMQGIFLDDVLLNTGAGVAPINPGRDASTWIAGATTDGERTQDDYDAALADFNKWARANRVTHSYIMATLPSILHEECAQRPNAHELWVYLEQRFAAQTLTSVASLWGRLLQIRLDDYPGVSAFLTAITKLELEIKRGGVEVHDTLLAGAILNGMGDRFPTTKELLLTLPIQQQTKFVFGERLLEAEKNAKVVSDAAFTTLPQNAFAATSGRGSGCGYVRKRQGRGAFDKPGSKCTRGSHKQKDCWKFLDDQFLAANPDKTAKDLPNRFAELRAKQALAQERAVRSNASTVPTDDSCFVDANAISMNLCDLSFDYLSPVGEEVAIDPPLKDVEALATKSTERRIITVTLDSGATTSCWKEKIQHQPLPKPVQVHGASSSMISYAHGTSVLPCPAVPEQQLKGVYSPEFRHNLVAVKALQRQGVEVVFPAHKNTAECKDPATGKVLWSFVQGDNGLYQAQVEIPPPQSSHAAVAAIPKERCATAHTSHPQHTPSMLLHYRLGHMSEGYIKTLVRKGAIAGLPKTFSSPHKDISQCCVPCIQAKTQATPHPLQRKRAPNALSKVHVDLVGPLSPTVKGQRYWLTIVDDFSRFGWTLLLHTKDQAKHRLLEWIAQVERSTGKKVRHVHGDRGGEFLNNILLKELRTMGVVYTFSNPDSPQQNGVAEARNKSIGRITRTLLLHSHAPQVLWGYAATHATVLNNLFPHGLLEGLTPFQVWHQKMPSMRRLRVWGCTGHVLMNKKERRHSGGKLGPVTKPCILVGLNPLGPGWLLLDQNQREIPSSDVVFQEDIPFHRREEVPETSQGLTWFEFEDEEEKSGDGHGNTQEQEQSCTHREQTKEKGAQLHGHGNQNPTPGEEPAPHPPLNIQSGPRRSLRLQGVQPDHLPPSNVRWNPTQATIREEEEGLAIHALLQTIVGGETGDKKQEIPVPATCKEALEGDYAKEWMESMVREYTGIQDTGTLEAVPRSVARNIIKCKWVYRIKRRPDGTPLFKSRLVAKGFSQKKGVDFFRTWAPTAKQNTARVFLHLVAMLGMHLHAMDVDQAFLQGKLEEEIYMEPAPMMPPPPGEGSVWRLRKPLYGLKQAPRQWHAKLKTVLLQLGFSPSHSDPSLFIKRTEKGSWILVYVDDLLIASQDTKELALTKNLLKKHFPMKDLGE